MKKKIRVPQEKNNLQSFSFNDKQPIDEKVVHIQKALIKKANEIGNKAYKLVSKEKKDEYVFDGDLKNEDLTPEIRKQCSKLYSFLGGEEIPPEMWNPEAVKRLAA